MQSFSLTWNQKVQRAACLWALRASSSSQWRRFHEFLHRQLTGRGDSRFLVVDNSPKELKWDQGQQEYWKNVANEFKILPKPKLQWFIISSLVLNSLFASISKKVLVASCKTIGSISWCSFSIVLTRFFTDSNLSSFESRVLANKILYRLWSEVKFSWKLKNCKLLINFIYF